MSDEVSQEQREHIDRLCETMDREHILAGMRFPPSEAYPPGGTMLDACRDMWIKRAQEGLPLPKHWFSGNESIERQIRERHAEYGTREWRKAHPWMVDVVRGE